MKRKACSPFPEPSLIENAKKESELMAELFRLSRVSSVWLEEDVDRTYLKLIDERNKAMIPFEPPEFYQNLANAVGVLKEEDGVTVVNRTRTCRRKSKAYGQQLPAITC